MTHITCTKAYIQSLAQIIKPLNVMQSKHGEYLQNKEARLARSAKHFESVFNQHTEFNSDAINTVQDGNIEEMSDEIPTDEEINSAIKDMKNNKSAGLDNISAEMLKAGENTTTQMFRLLISKIWEEKKVPEDWKGTPIHKKGNKANCDNYRGISLLSVAGKVLSRIIYNRLAPFAEKILAYTQCGFRKSKS